jgi:hypothetical protein
MAASPDTQAMYEAYMKVCPEGYGSGAGGGVWDVSNCPNYAGEATCWATSAYQVGAAKKCKLDAQGAYDEVMAASPDTQAMYEAYMEVCPEGYEYIEEPVVEEPIVEEPVVEEPIVEEPVVEEPIVEEPVVEEPVIEEPELIAPVEATPVGATITEEETSEDDESCCDCTCDGSAPPAPLVCSPIAPLYEIKVGEDCVSITCSNKTQIYIAGGNGTDPTCENCTVKTRPNEDNTQCITDLPCEENSIEYNNGTCEKCPDFSQVNEDKTVCEPTICPFEN